MTVDCNGSERDCDSFTSADSGPLSAHSPWKDSASDQRAENLLHALRDRLDVGSHDDVGMDRRLVRIGHTGEVLDIPGERLPVEPLDVAIDERLQAGIEEHLDEGEA